MIEALYDEKDAKSFLEAKIAENPDLMARIHPEFSPDTDTTTEVDDTSIVKVEPKKSKSRRARKKKKRKDLPQKKKRKEVGSMYLGEKGQGLLNTLVALTGVLGRRVRTDDLRGKTLKDGTPLPDPNDYVFYFGNFENAAEEAEQKWKDQQREEAAERGEEIPSASIIKKKPISNNPELDRMCRLYRESQERTKKVRDEQREKERRIANGAIASRALNKKSKALFEKLNKLNEQLEKENEKLLMELVDFYDKYHRMPAYKPSKAVNDGNLLPHTLRQYCNELGQGNWAKVEQLLKDKLDELGKFEQAEAKGEAEVVAEPEVKEEPKVKEEPEIEMEPEVEAEPKCEEVQKEEIDMSVTKEQLIQELIDFSMRERRIPRSRIRGGTPPDEMPHDWEDYKKIMKAEGCKRIRELVEKALEGSQYVVDGDGSIREKRVGGRPKKVSQPDEEAPKIKKLKKVKSETILEPEIQETPAEVPAKPVIEAPVEAVETPVEPVVETPAEPTPEVPAEPAPQPEPQPVAAEAPVEAAAPTPVAPRDLTRCVNSSSTASIDIVHEVNESSEILRIYFKPTMATIVMEPLAKSQTVELRIETRR